MSETVTVKSFEPGNDWASEDGKIALTFYECVFDRGGHDFTATWNKKQGTGEPPIGESIDGEFYEKKPGDWRFRKASKPQGGSSGGGGEYKGGGKSPDQQASIVRQHSQEMSLRALEIFSSAVWREDDLKAAIVKWTDFFAADADAAQSASGARVDAASSDRTSPHPQVPPHQDIYGLLEKAGVPGAIATLLTSWMIETQSPEKQDEAISALQDDARKEKCVQWAKAGYEKAHGPLPTVAKSDDDIPF